MSPVRQATQVEQLKETAAPLESSDEQTLAEVGGFGSLEAWLTSFNIFQCPEVAQVEACAEAVEAAGADCKALIKTCMDFLVSHGPEMKEPPRVGGIVSSGSELKQLMARCLTRINESGPQMFQTGIFATL